MGELLQKQAEPSTPAANYSHFFMDTNDSSRPKVKNDAGIVQRASLCEGVNFIRNSGMWFAQRQAPGTLTTRSNTTGRTGTADGWGVTNENASIQYIRTDTRSAPETGLIGTHYGTFSKITNTGKIMISQVLEGIDCLALRGRTVRFQLWLKASAAKTIKIAVIQLNSSGTVDTMPATFISAFGANNVDPTLGTNLAFIAPKSGVTPDNCSAGANAFSCSVTTAWQRFGGVVDIPSNCRNIVVMVWTDTQFAAADSFSMSQVSLTDGYEIQEWAPLDIRAELQRCQRFYTKTYEVDTDPTTAVLPGALRAVVTKAATALGVQFHWRFPVNMRGNPTITTVSPVTGANANPRRTGGTAADETAVATANVNSVSADITATDAASGAVGDAVQVQAVADASGTNGEFV